MEPNFISKLPNVSSSIFSVMSNLANEHQAINLSQGFPNFKTDKKLIKLVSKAMRSGNNQYAPMAGIPELRKAISKKFEYLYGSSYNPETEITVTAGATQAIYTIISTFIRPDDEVIIFTPAYDSYEPTIRLNGGKTIAIQLEHPNYTINWDTVRENITAKTKMIIINTPHNPTGTIMSESDMLTLQELVDGTNIIVLSDEVYEHIIFDGKTHQSACKFPALKQHSFIVASFGKTFHNTGWKMGYCCAADFLMEEFQKVHQFNVFCVNRPVQHALAKYLKKEYRYTELGEFYQEKRDYFLSFIKDSRFKPLPCSGTYFQVLDYSEITRISDVVYAKELTVNNLVASIPLSVFNKQQEDNNVLRFCFAKDKDTLKAAGEILCEI